MGFVRVHVCVSCNQMASWNCLPHRPIVVLAKRDLVLDLIFYGVMRVFGKIAR